MDRDEEMARQVVERIECHIEIDYGAAGNWCPDQALQHIAQALRSAREEERKRAVTHVLSYGRMAAANEGVDSWWGDVQNAVKCIASAIESGSERAGDRDNPTPNPPSL